MIANESMMQGNGTAWPGMQQVPAQPVQYAGRVKHYMHVDKRGPARACGGNTARLVGHQSNSTLAK